MFSQRIL